MPLSYIKRMQNYYLTTRQGTNAKTLNAFVDIDRESQANILLDKRPRGDSKVSGGVFQGAPAGSQFQHRVEAGKD